MTKPVRVPLTQRDAEIDAVSDRVIDVNAELADLRSRAEINDIRLRRLEVAAGLTSDATPSAVIKTGIPSAEYHHDVKRSLQIGLLIGLVAGAVLALSLAEALGWA